MYKYILSVPDVLYCNLLVIVIVADTMCICRAYLYALCVLRVSGHLSQ